MQGVYFLTFREAREILRARKIAKINPNLNKTAELIEVEVIDNYAVFPDGSRIKLELIRKIAEDEGTVYFFKDGELYKAAIAGEHFYKLVPTIPPTIEIDGIRMHRTKDTDPLRDTLAKVETVKPRRGENVLDTCMGLGYTAIESARRGAFVLTIEKDKNVIELAKINPWSRELFEWPNIKVIHGDSYELVKNFDNESFDVIIHDPPRFSLAGELYSREFYEELYRILKPGGRLFHYVGNPGKKYRRKDMQRGVMERLRSVGFIKVKKVEEALGVFALKPNHVNRA
ncbi:class I SAM-dependent methyltransferase [Pyrococcus abyssi]|uniref:Predicted archaeal methyltransferase n=1 Tax=Pyrococcus abyssi (strain GE5 / Orsay) TaxID=272844 RepID=Q9V042_PYRAB|nr:methyltransferase domain-containing protein [Pyrococcus abyssi]CAB49864.1 Predicted archaeal methyltransferase [Pyrococcus abyssi GE5]CCE70361.1 TPA: SAM-dependent methyltransferase [Pyrococcus abyssi GE5]